MRNLLLAMVLAMWPAAMASAQIGGNPQDPAGGQPGQFEQGDREGGFRRMGPPPNPMFTAIDVDGDGVITKAELRKAIVALKRLDTDGDGNITLAEASPASPWGDPAQFVERMITENDKNGDGILSADEVPERMQRMLEGADQNGDGAFSREELTLGMENMRNRFRGGRDRGGFRGGQNAFGPGANGPGADPRTGQFLQHDVNNDGRLTYDEIPRAMRAAFQPGDDRNGDGAIDAAELQAVIARMGGGAQAIGAGGDPNAGRDPNTFRDPNRRNR
jgi:Ca2+-binding EF-hand superfamily protein